MDIQVVPVEESSRVDSEEYDNHHKKNDHEEQNYKAAS